MPEGAAELARLIEATKQSGSDAYAEIERLEAERRVADSYEAARVIDDQIERLKFEIGRLGRLLPELEERLADAKWDERLVAFDKHRRNLVAATRKAITAVEAAAAANAAVVAAHHQASQELGTHINSLPLQAYLGVLMPDLVSMWRRQVEPQLYQMERAELTRPPKPRPPGAPQAVYRDPTGVNAPPKPPVVVAVAPPPPADPPQPAREARRDPPPPDGERQVHVIAGGDFNLPDGTRAKIGDRVNLSSKLAEIWVGKGVAEFVDDTPAPVVGDLKATVNFNLVGGGR